MVFMEISRRRVPTDWNSCPLLGLRRIRVVPAETRDQTHKISRNLSFWGLAKTGPRAQKGVAEWCGQSVSQVPTLGIENSTCVSSKMNCEPVGTLWPHNFLCVSNFEVGYFLAVDSGSCLRGSGSCPSWEVLGLFEHGSL